MLHPITPEPRPAAATLRISAGGLSLTLIASTSAEGFAHQLAKTAGVGAFQKALAAATAQAVAARHSELAQAHRQCLEEIPLALHSFLTEQLSDEQSSARGFKTAEVIFSAPHGWGKTTRAEELRLKFGCDHVVDEWLPHMGLKPGALHLTQSHPEELFDAGYCNFVAFGWQQEVAA